MPILKLGKQAHKHDDRTLMMSNFMEVPVFPSVYDFDKHRRPFPVHNWGNLKYGDCVIGAQANCLMRLERVEQRQTLKIKDQDAIDRYKLLTGCVKPGDEHDTGLVMLDSFKNWRNTGFQVVVYRRDGTPTNRHHKFTIAAYGELDPADTAQLRAATYLFGGIHFGFSLPLSARTQTTKGYWDVVSEGVTSPGSWGGHAVYSNHYEGENFYVWSWGEKIRVSNNFIKRYCDEVWAVVDNLDKWRKTDHLDVQGLIGKLHNIGAQVNS